MCSHPFYLSPPNNKKKKKKAHNQTRIDEPNIEPNDKERKANNWIFCSVFSAWSVCFNDFFFVRFRLIHYLCLFRRFFFNFSGFNMAFHLKLCVNVFGYSNYDFQFSIQLDLKLISAWLGSEARIATIFFFIKNLIMHFV